MTFSRLENIEKWIYGDVPHRYHRQVRPIMPALKPRISSRDNWWSRVTSRLTLMAIGHDSCKQVVMLWALQSYKSTYIARDSNRPARQRSLITLLLKCSGSQRNVSLMWSETCAIDRLLTADITLSKDYSSTRDTASDCAITYVVNRWFEIGVPFVKPV